MNIRDVIPGYNKLVLPYHFVQAAVAGAKYGFPGKKMRVIGVTGTNGKTTTCFMIYKMLNESGHKAGVMTTVGWGVPGLTKKDLISDKGLIPKDNAARGSGGKTSDLRVEDGIVRQVEHMTTADSFTLNRRMKKIADSGAEFLVLEVTSHALTQFRTLGIPIEIAVMTNVTHEHLDYHKTFANYVSAKCKLFSKAKYGIINADDKSAKQFIEAISPREYITYGIKSQANLRASRIKLEASGVKYSCGDIIIETQLPGEFNVYNSLATLAVGRRLGLTNTEIAKGIFALTEVEGRMNRLALGQKFEVIVDYAHTPDAFLKVFESIKPSQKTGRIISLFGGAGRRDESTRKERGEIAGKYSDVCIITEDDSRDENPLDIMEEFREGCLSSKMSTDQILMIPDREDAIFKAVSLAKAGDVVLILGKGHEKTILRDDGPHPFEDLKVAQKAIKNKIN
ncbi:UDP-N-acetylmuramoyl-L-alanyl-D-glutamate--2,6-diaminopimelate ligase [Candidatus Saccharibacteria bacterium]|nr:UDP-N-acetylmuramoyl-L-alanyl-D-glutamate--2,6-diaminopimelate ligase [Candidatus Saccharibacteria bacterium]